MSAPFRARAALSSEMETVTEKEKRQAITPAPQQSQVGGSSGQDGSKSAAATTTRDAHRQPDDAQRGGGARTRSGVYWKVYERLSYVPPRCRYDPDKPFEFNIGINILFGKETQL